MTKETVTCDNCGVDEVVVGDFCPHCGNKLPLPREKQVIASDEVGKVEDILGDIL